MKITLFTLKSCVKCPAAKALVEEAAKEAGAEFECADAEENFALAIENQITSVPAIMVGNEVVCRGFVPKKEELINVLKRQNNASKP